LIVGFETHYKNQHQPLDLAMKALDFLLKGLGIVNMETNAQRSMVTAVQDGTPGYSLSRTTEKYQRPIAFVYAGDTPETDGASVFLTPDRLRQSINYQSKVHFTHLDTLVQANGKQVVLLEPPENLIFTD
jgi:hypothetical protein